MKSKFLFLVFFILLHCQLINAIEVSKKKIESYDVFEKKLVISEYDSVVEYYAYPVTIKLGFWGKASFGSILPVYTLNRGWVRAQFLEKGDKVVYLKNGKISYRAIWSVQTGEKFNVFYTYTNVHDTHTYFKDGVLVHNNGGSESNSNGSSSGDKDDTKSGPITQPYWYDYDHDKEYGAIDSTSNGNSDNGNNSGGTTSSNNSTSQEDKKEALALDQTTSILNTAQKIQKAFEKIQLNAGMSGIAKEFTKIVVEEVRKKRQSVQKGDPVLVTSGAFIHEEIDIFLEGMLSTIEVKRTYSSAGGGASSLFGSNWITNLDTKIVRGVSESVAENVKQIVDYKAELQKMLSQLKKYESYSFTRDVKKTINELYSALEKEYEKLKAESEDILALSNLNAFVVNSSTPVSYYSIGNGLLTYIDEMGYPIVFEYSGVGVWTPINLHKAQYMRIESRDGKDSLTNKGFILFEKGGKEIWFDGWGLVEKIVDKNDNEVRFIRDNEKKVLKKIISPDGESVSFEYNSSGFLQRVYASNGYSVQYEYDGNNLAYVTDIYGDKSFFDYDSNGKLIKYIKPDGSFTSFTYGLQNSLGEYLTTSTTNEEGFSEYFEYDLKNNLTIYKDHSGFIEYVYYDDEHRTIKEIDIIGRVTTYVYDELGNIAAKTVNGDTVKYTYDKRGNKTQALYSDGSKASWNYNKFDQVTHHTDRDGVSQSVEYDIYGNAVSFKIDNKIVERAVYDLKGLIIRTVSFDGTNTYYEYDDTFNLIKRTVGDMIEQFEYDNHGNIIRYTDGKKRIFTYTYDKKNIVQTLPTGLQRTLNFNNRKDLVHVKEVDLNTNEERLFYYEYDKRHLLKNVRIGERNFVSYSYYPAGQLKSETYGEKGIEDYWVTEYDLQSGSRYSVHKKMFAKNGEQVGKTYTETFALEKGGKTLSYIAPFDRIMEFSFDPWNRLVSIKNFDGELTHRILSAGGRILQEENQFGGLYENTYNNAGLIRSIAEKGKRPRLFSYTIDGRTESQIDQEGNVVKFEYNAQGLVTREETENGSVFYEYDSIGRISLIVWGKDNNIQNCEQYVELNYSKDSREVRLNYGGVYTETFIVNAWGEIVKRVDGEENTLVYEYDSLGRLISTIDAYKFETKYKYNALGFISKIIYPDQSEKCYYYNNLGLLTAVHYEDIIQWQGTYDEAGRLVSEVGLPSIEKAYTYDNLNRIKTVSIGGEVFETYTYTNRGRNTNFIDGNGNQYVYAKDMFGRLISEKNRLGNMQNYVYDDISRLVKKTDFNKKNQTMDYVDSENKMYIQYENGNETVFTYTLLGLISESRNKTGSIFYSYNKAGLLERQFDESAGETTLYEYDKAGRRKSYTSGNRKVIYEYGSNGEVKSVIDNSQRLSVHYSYDSMMREVSRTFGNGVTQTTDYDNVGRVLLITERNGSGEILRAEGYLYNDRGQISHKVDERANVVRYDYDLQGRLRTVFYPFSLEKMDYDKQEAIEAGLYLRNDMAKGELLSLLSDDAQRLSILLNMMSFGRANLLRTTQTVWKEDFTYDKNSNRKTKKTEWGIIEYYYDEENHLVYSGLKNSGTNYSYDANGNLIEKINKFKAMQFTYNEINRMESSFVVDSLLKTTSTTMYEYDAFGRRNLTKNGKFPTVRILYDGFSHDIIRESEVFFTGDFTTNFSGSQMQYRLSESSTERYLFVEDSFEQKTHNNTGEYTSERSSFTGSKTPLFAKGEIIGMNYSESATSKKGTLYFGTDIIGSIRNTTQEYASLESRYDYDAFGNPYSGDFITGLHNGYLGKPYNTETNLYNYGFRDYSPQFARFTTKDPIRDGNNWFSYVVNDPINFVDLWGLETVFYQTTVKQQHFATVKNENNEDVANYLGNSTTVTVDIEGCYLVCVSNATFALNEKGKTVTELNAVKSNFLPVTSTSPQSVAVEKFAENNGLVFDYWTKAVQGNLSTKINEIAASDTDYAVLAQLPYNSAGDLHWVTITGETEMRFDDELKKDVEVVKVLGSSVNDNVEKSRPKTWKISGEYVYVPVSEIVKIHTYTAVPSLVENKKNN